MLLVGVGGEEGRMKGGGIGEGMGMGCFASLRLALRKGWREGGREGRAGLFFFAVWMEAWSIELSIGV